jgi:hypothetical protein
MLLKIEIWATQFHLDTRSLPMEDALPSRNLRHVSGEFALHLVPVEDVVLLAPWALGASEAAHQQHGHAGCDHHSRKAPACDDPVN